MKYCVELCCSGENKAYKASSGLTATGGTETQLKIDVSVYLNT